MNNNAPTAHGNAPGMFDDLIPASSKAGMFDDLIPATSSAPADRNAFAVANDAMIEAGNAIFGGAKAAVDMVSPGSAPSRGLGFMIQRGLTSQSDTTKAAKAKLDAEIATAGGLVDEAEAMGRYILSNPDLALAQAAGSFAIPGVAVKGAGAAAGAMGAGARGVQLASQAGGVAAGAVLAGGDAAGNAYDLVLQTPVEVLKRNPAWADLRDQGVPEGEVQRELAKMAAADARLLPSLVGGAFGAFGAERLLAGGKGFSGNVASRALKAGTSEALQEGGEEVVTGYEGRRAAQQFNPAIEPGKGSGADFVGGAALGFVPGAVLGAGQRQPAVPAATPVEASAVLDAEPQQEAQLALPAPRVVVNSGGHARMDGSDKTFDEPPAKAVGRAEIEVAREPVRAELKALGYEPSPQRAQPTPVVVDGTGQARTDDQVQVRDATVEPAARVVGREPVEVPPPAERLALPYDPTPRATATPIQVDGQGQARTNEQVQPPERTIEPAARVIGREPVRMPAEARTAQQPVGVAPEQAAAGDGTPLSPFRAAIQAELAALGFRPAQAPTSADSRTVATRSKNTQVPTGQVAADGAPAAQPAEAERLPSDVLRSTRSNAAARASAVSDLLRDVETAHPDVYRALFQPMGEGVAGSTSGADISNHGSAATALEHALSDPAFWGKQKPASAIPAKRQQQFFRWASRWFSKRDEGRSAGNDPGAAPLREAIARAYMNAVRGDQAVRSVGADIEFAVSRLRAAPLAPTRQVGTEMDELAGRHTPAPELSSSDSSKPPSERSSYEHLFGEPTEMAGVEDEYRYGKPLDIRQRAAVTLAIDSLVESGMPASWLDGLTRIFAYTGTNLGSAAYLPKVGAEQTAVIAMADSAPWLQGRGMEDQQFLREALAHEIGHHVDRQPGHIYGFSAESPRLKLKVDEDRGELLPVGDIATELVAVYRSESDLAELLEYPLGALVDGNMLSFVAQQELFAQAVRAYFTRGALLQADAPLTYGVINGIVRGQNRPQANVQAALWQEPPSRGGNQPRGVGPTHGEGDLQQEDAGEAAIADREPRTHDGGARQSSGLPGNRSKRQGTGADPLAARVSRSGGTSSNGPASNTNDGQSTDNDDIAALRDALSAEQRRAVDLRGVEPSSPRHAAIVASAGRLFSRRVAFFASGDSAAPGGGAYAPSRPGVVFINAADPHPDFVLGHELLHDLRRAHPDLYSVLARVMHERVQDTTARREKQDESYGFRVPDSVLEEENLADLSGLNFTDDKFWTRFEELTTVPQQRTFWQWAAKWLANIMETFAGLPKRDLDTMAGMFAAAKDMRETMAQAFAEAARRNKRVASVAAEANFMLRGPSILRGDHAPAPHPVATNVDTIQNQRESHGTQRADTARDRGTAGLRSAGTQQDLGATVAGEPPSRGWAGATRIRGKAGPLTVYRGAAGRLDPGHFDLASLGKASGNPSSGLGVWFTTGRGEAASYGQIEAVHLDIRRPAVIKAEELPAFDNVQDAHAWRENLRDEGYDGLIITARHLGKQETHVVAFTPEQVIRADHGTSPTILRSYGKHGVFGQEKQMARGPGRVVAAGVKATAPVTAAAQTANGAADRIGKELAKLTGTAKLGAKVVEKAEEAIRTKSSWSWIERVKHGLVSDYGLPEEYLEAKISARGVVNSKLREAKRTLDRLSVMTPDQLQIAYQWLQERPDTARERALLGKLPDHLRVTVLEMKDDIDYLSQDAVELGLITDETYERNAMAYIHRSYKKYEAELSGSELAARQRAQRLKGDQFKGRGMELEVALDRVRGDLPADLKGVKIEVSEKRDEAGKLVRRDFRAAGTKALDGYTPAGTWEVRDATKKGELRIWRDFTVAERQRMGEIEDARYGFAKTMLQGVRDVETARLLRWVSVNHSRAKADGLEVVEINQRAAQTFTLDEWVKVPDTKIPGTAVNRYGDLAGRYIPGVMWNDLQGAMELPNGTWDKLLGAWKISKTALSPAVHVNNVMANFVMADLADVGVDDIRRALETIVKAKAGDSQAKRLIERYEDSGAEAGSFAANEIKVSAIEPLLKEIARSEPEAVQRVSLANVVALLAHGHIREAGVAAAKTLPGRAIGGTVETLIRAYQAEDSVFRLAKFVNEIEAGKSDQQAGKAARDAFLNYDINAPWVRAARRTVLPFISFTYRAIPLLAKAAATKPWKFAKYAAMGYVLNTLAYSLLGEAGDEEKEKRLMPEDRAGFSFVGLPKMMRLPWNSDENHPMWLDIRRWIPGGDLADVNNSKAAIPLPAWLSIGGPLSLLIDFYSNTNFQGQPIVKQTDSPAQMIEKTADMLLKFALPNLPLPGLGTIMRAAGAPVDQGNLDPYSWTAIEKALRDARTKGGNDKAVTEAVARGFGVKLESRSMADDIGAVVGKHRAQESEIRRELRQVADKGSRGEISKEEAERRMKAEIGKLVELGRKTGEKLVTPAR